MGQSSSFNIKLSFSSDTRGTGSQTFSDGAATVFEFTVTSGDTSDFGGSLTSVDQDDGDAVSGTFSGEIKGNVLVVGYGGGSFSGNFTATEGATGPNSAGSEQTTATVLRQNTIADINLAQGHLAHLQQQLARGQRAAGTGATQVANGIKLQHGMAAGEGFGFPWGVWASYQHSEFEDDFAGTAFDADGDAFFVGVDVSPWEHVVFGTALGFRNTDIDTFFNAGEQDIDSLTVIPYLAVLLPELGLETVDMSVDMSIGYSSIDIDQFRTAGAAQVTSSTDADRIFFAMNLNANRAVGALYVTGRVGFVVARETQDDFTESDGSFVAEKETQFGQLRLGADAAYTFEASYGDWEPFVSVTYEYDFTREKTVLGGGVAQPENDADGVLLGIGIRFFGNHGFNGSLEYNTMLGREDFDADTINLVVRGEF